ncbi:MAG: hypothetical protein ACRDF8_13105, partial [Chloroflexota bacterium]
MTQTRQATDQEIAALAARAQHDRSARKRLFELYGPNVYAYLLHQLDGRKKLAERLGFDVFSTAFSRMSDFHAGLASLPVWLYS